MGSGASRKPKLEEKSPRKSRRKLRGKALEVPKDVTNPAMLRRRKVLFCTTGHREFESVPPIEQYAQDPGDDDDPVFERFGRSDEANAFRSKAESIRYFEDGGYLREDAIALLDLDLHQGCFLSDRLFLIGQIQTVPGSAARRPLLTCYELLALHSVFRHGTEDEFLELLFCVFDVDGDDRISVSDLTSAIDAFQSYIDIDIEKTHVSSKRLAEQAITEYSSLEINEEKYDSEQDEKSDDESSKKSDDTDLSKVPLTGDTKPPKQRRRCGFCRGKPPADDTSDDDDDDDDLPVVKPPPSRRGLCRGKSPADSDDPPEPKIERNKNNKVKKGRSCFCSCNVGRKKQIPALNFKQWHAWLAQSGLLPDGFAQEHTPPPPRPSATLQRPRSNSMQLGRGRSNSIRGIDDDDMSD